jgi:hypothetical protein
LTAAPAPRNVDILMPDLALDLAVLVTGLAESQRSVLGARGSVNMLELATALEAYTQQHGHLPPPSIDNKDGRPLLS